MRRDLSTRSRHREPATKQWPNQYALEKVKEAHTINVESMPSPPEVLSVMRVIELISDLLRPWSLPDNSLMYLRY